jgi:hypothetical protein
LSSKINIMGVSQIILLSLVGLNLMISSYMHGKPKEGNHSVFITIVGTLLHLTLLYFGGFFD